MSFSKLEFLLLLLAVLLIHFTCEAKKNGKGKEKWKWKLKHKWCRCDSDSSENSSSESTEMTTTGPQAFCSDLPCQNGGTCTEGDDSFICDCSGTGFSGPTCEDEIFCFSEPCKNNGTCIEGETMFICDCTETGFMGPTCEEGPPNEVYCNECVVCTPQFGCFGECTAYDSVDDVLIHADTCTTLVDGKCAIKSPCIDGDNAEVQCGTPQALAGDIGNDQLLVCYQDWQFLTGLCTYLCVSEEIPEQP